MDAFFAFTHTLSPLQIYLALAAITFVVSTGFAPFVVDWVLITSGLMIADHSMNSGLVFFIVLVALVCGESLVFTGGKYFARRANGHRFTEKITQHLAYRWLHHRAQQDSFALYCLLRFTPVYKATSLLTASVLGMPVQHYVKPYLLLTCIYALSYTFIPSELIQHSGSNQETIAKAIFMAILSLLVAQFIASRCIRYYRSNTV